MSCKLATVLQNVELKKRSSFSLETFKTACAWRHKHGMPMKLGLCLAALLAAAVLVTAAASEGKVTYIGHDKVAKGGTLLTAPDLTVLISHRASPGEVEVHDKE